MRVDIVTVFPAYFSVLELSLAGRAQESGLLAVAVHDLRDWTDDRHRTVDDAPYGGGAGMVMRPEPWGRALDALAPPGEESGAVLVVPTPSGSPLTHALASDLAQAAHLVVACGRYEGIDQRVLDHAATRLRVVEVSVGDYVLNGGEVAALVLLEAVTRLVPGFMGNPESLAEESHGVEGLLEYPSYTRPATWRGLAVPDVLLSGDHARIAAWRREQSLQRTAERRPDLLHPSRRPDLPGLPEAEWRLARPSDAGELLTLTRACWLDVALENDSWQIPPLREGYDDVVAALATHRTFVLRVGGRLVASARGHLGGAGREPHEAAADDEWLISRVMVAPDLRGRGLGRWLLARLEEAAPPRATSYALVTGHRSDRNLRMYRRAGYRPDRHPPTQGLVEGVVRLVKPRRGA